VNSDNPYEGMHGHMVEDIKIGIQGLEQASFVQVKRMANAATHALVVGARTHVMDMVMWTLVPPCICYIVRERNHLPPVDFDL
jgi:hypothetical protein